MLRRCIGHEIEALLSDSLASAGVELGDWDGVVLRWLANRQFGSMGVASGGVRKTDPVGECTWLLAAADMLRT